MNGAGGGGVFGPRGPWVVSVLHTVSPECLRGQGQLYTVPCAYLNAQRLPPEIPQHLTMTACIFILCWPRKLYSRSQAGDITGGNGIVNCKVLYKALFVIIYKLLIPPHRDKRYCGDLLCLLSPVFLPGRFNPAVCCLTLNSLHGPPGLS